MNYRSLLGLALLLFATGCGNTVSDRPPSDLPSSTSTPEITAQQTPTSVSSQPLIKPSLSPSSSSSSSLPSPQGQVAPRTSSSTPLKPRIDPPAASDPVPVKPDPADAETSEATGDKGGEIQRDYAFTTPIAETGKVTVRDRIRFVDTDKLITPCPTDSAPYALAESTHYRVQICSEEYDPKLPKYYIGQAKDGSGELRITSNNLNEARQLIFKNDNYTYVLYRDSARPDQSNAYLEVYEPNGDSYAEALFYLYE